jgi:hypothetical protein
MTKLPKVLIDPSGASKNFLIDLYGHVFGGGSAIPKSSIKFEKVVLKLRSESLSFSYHCTTVGKSRHFLLTLPDQ